MTPTQLQTQKVLMAMHKPLIINAILKDHPEALNELQKRGLYVPVGKRTQNYE
jgi:hypothetical protein